MIKNENAEIRATLELINDVRRLGLGYHFEKEIAEALDKFLSLERSSGTCVHRSLHEAALSFRLLREYGYDVSPGIAPSTVYILVRWLAPYVTPPLWGPSNIYSKKHDFREMIFNNCQVFSFLIIFTK